MKDLLKHADDFAVTAVTVCSERRNSYVAPSPRLLTAITEAIHRDEGIGEDLLERAEVQAEAVHDAYHESKLDAMRECSMTTNQARVINAHTALSGYLEEPRSEEEAVIDLLTDLWHFCDRHEINFEVEVRTSGSPSALPRTSL